MYRCLVASILTLACLVGSPLMAAEPTEVATERTEVTTEKRCTRSTAAEAEVTHAWIPPFSQAPMSSDLQPQIGTPIQAAVVPCHTLGQVRYIQTSFCCSNGKLREIKETCGPQYGTWGTWIWKYSGSYCIGLFCSGGGGGDPV